MPDDEHYFGLGDKTGPLDHRDLAFTNWNSDMFGWQESTDPLYKTIPFFLAMRRGVAYGLFLDNTYRSNFDFGKEARDLYSFGSDGGPLDYYFFYGHPQATVHPTGRTHPPPLFTLGYQQCRYSYYPQAQSRRSQRIRKRQIPSSILTSTTSRTIAPSR
jgi:alpha-glucosidase